jgi:hypothetical protein
MIHAMNNFRRMDGFHHIGQIFMVKISNDFPSQTGIGIITDITLFSNSKFPRSKNDFIVSGRLPNRKLLPSKRGLGDS